MAVSKPARIPVASEDSGDQTLLEIVRAWNAGKQSTGKKGYCVPIHFLDRPVSGVILFALSSKAATRLNAMFRERRMHKTYVAVTEQSPSSPELTLEHWLVKDAARNKASISHDGIPEAKKCVLSYKVISTHEKRSLVIVRPITGRSHQIRAQMAAIGAPLVGDVKYGAMAGWDGKVGLHAFCLDFSHPVGGHSMRIFAPVPSYWHEIWSNRLLETIDNFLL